MGLFPHIDLDGWKDLAERAVEAVESIAADVRAIAHEQGIYRD